MLKLCKLADDGNHVQSQVCVLTAGAAGEAAVVVQVTHCLTGLVGSIDLLVALYTASWNNKGQNAFRKVKARPLTVCLIPSLPF